MGRTRSKRWTKAQKTHPSQPTWRRSRRKTKKTWKTRDCFSVYSESCSYEWQLDLFILWPLTSSDHFSAAQQLVDSLRVRVSNMNEKKRKLMQKGLTVCRFPFP
ncbi:uncharacterized protein LOC141617676 isoform X1 [Silene latifolia]|uniref:uncharacterized protein LOC141617676 isoform X1 n=1 Tax=Silene latifolia TaxID=37657 RepID=UPI003D786FE8